MIVYPVKLDTLSRTLFFVSQGMKIIGIHPFQFVQVDEGTGKVQAKKEKPGRSSERRPPFYLEWGCGQSFPGKDKKSKTEQGESQSDRVFRPDYIDMEHGPGKRGKQVHTVAPFDLQGVEQQVEKTVAAEEGKHPAGLPGQTCQSGRQEKTEEKTCLGRAVEPQIVWIEQIESDKAFEHNPGKIGDDTGNDHPAEVDSAADQTVEGKLDSDMAKSIWQRSG